MKNRNKFRKKKKYIPCKPVNGIPGRYAKHISIFKNKAPKGENINMCSFAFFVFVISSITFLIAYFIFWMILSFVSLIFPFEVTFGKVLALIIANEIMGFAFNPQGHMNSCKKAFSKVKELYKELLDL